MVHGTGADSLENASTWASMRSQNRKTVSSKYLKINLPAVIIGSEQGYDVRVLQAI